MSGETVKVEGLKRLVRQLKKIDKELAKEVTKVNREAAELVAATARERAPRRSGTLAGSIRAGATLTSANVRAGSKAIPYAGPIHFGWPRHNISPQPFLFEALDARRPEVIALYEIRVAELGSRTITPGAD